MGRCLQFKHINKTLRARKSKLRMRRKRKRKRKESDFSAKLVKFSFAFECIIDQGIAKGLYIRLKNSV